MLFVSSPNQELPKEKRYHLGHIILKPGIFGPSNSVLVSLTKTVSFLSSEKWPRMKLVLNIVIRSGMKRTSGNVPFISPTINILICTVIY